MVSISLSALTAVATFIISANAKIQANIKPYSQDSVDFANPLKFLAGTGPYNQHAGFGISTDVPFQCEVDQVHMFARHGERYPTTSKSTKIKKVYQKLKEANISSYIGPLAFVQDWEYFARDEDYDQETSTGPYSGLLDAYQSGSDLRIRYDHLYDSNKVLPIWAASKKRCVDTARAFAQAFCGSNYTDGCSIQVVSEDASSGANSLDNTEACTEFDEDENADYLAGWDTSYLTREADRLNHLSPGYNLTSSDVEQLLGYCGYELNAKGESPVCEALSREAFVYYAYDKDLTKFYQNGPGNSLSHVSGGLYANATATLLKQGPEEGKIFFSFSHDNDMLRYLSVFDLFESELPNDELLFSRQFRSSEIVPMGAKLIHERMSCYNETSGDDDVYVRMIINDQVYPIPSCHDGPGFSCGLDDYADIVESNMGDYPTECKLNSTLPQHVSFYWDWGVTFEEN